MSKRNNSQQTLFRFIKKKRKDEEDGYYNSEVDPSSNVNSSTENGKNKDISNAIISSANETEIMDLENYIKERCVNRETKFQLLNNPWMPDESFEFPASVFGKKKLRFQKHWMSRFSWLVYTKSDGALCKYCVLFAHETSGKGSHQMLKSLVTEPFRDWKHALECFNEHSSNAYHKNAIIMGSNFLKVCHDSNLDIRNTVSETRKKQVEENRKKLIPIIETIKFCGRQGLALRGTNDSGPITNSDEEPKVNDGNFRALLRFKLRSGDRNLADHMQNVALNATYISPNIQNELISIIGNLIQKKIVNNVKETEYFSILADESMDISRLEELSISVRYTQKQDNIFVIKEDFLCFVRVENLTGQTIAEKILSSLWELGINCDNLVGQGYDGAASMKGSFNGVQALIRKKYPEALYIHCSSHSLNLALCHACDIPDIRNCIGTVKAVGNFIRSSSKRTDLLKNYLKSDFPNNNWTTIIPMCQTRWVENHDGLIRFKEVYKCLVATLEELSFDSDTETSSKSSSLLKSILSSEFVISLCSLSMLFSYTSILCKVLQSPSCDLISAVQHVENIADVFSTIRENIEEKFAKIFKSASEMLNEVNEEIRLPRIAAIQKLRNNIDTNDPEKYFRISVAIPLLDDFIQQIRNRFSQHKNTINSFCKLLPSVCSEETLNCEDFKLYEKRIKIDLLEPEFEIWKTKWRKNSKMTRPSSAIEALSECNPDLFPNIYILLKIFSTLPVTTCTPERSFSTLKRLKTYLRNCCSEDRLTGLALMSVHRDIDINNEKIINTFAMQKSRKLDFVL